jgi:hypothetical protein
LAGEVLYWRVEARVSFPQTKHVRGKPSVDQAYVTPATVTHPITEVAVGVLSPAYKSAGRPAPRGVRMTLRQAEAFGRVILVKVREVRRWNREQVRKTR